MRSAIINSLAQKLVQFCILLNCGAVFLLGELLVLIILDLKAVVKVHFAPSRVGSKPFFKDLVPQP